MSTPSTSADSAAITIVYDGECPFCSRYIGMLRLRDAVGPVQLIDARSRDPAVARLQRMGYDLNDGMVVEYAGRTHHGADGLNLLALLSTGSGTFNRINAAVFRSTTASKLLYPALRLGRNLTLRALGRRQIDPA